MAELADALDSGSNESNLMQVQALLSAPKSPRAKISSRAFSFLLFIHYPSMLLYIVKE